MAFFSLKKKNNKTNLERSFKQINNFFLINDFINLKKLQNNFFKIKQNDYNIYKIITVIFNNLVLKYSDFKKNISLENNKISLLQEYILFFINFYKKNINFIDKVEQYKIKDILNTIIKLEPYSIISGTIKYEILDKLYTKYNLFEQKKFNLSKKKYKLK